MASKPKHPYTIVRGGRLLDIAKRKAPPADILIKGDTIAELGRPGRAAPAGAKVVDARNRLMHPGLINAHTHSPGNLGKGMGDLWSLELLLTAPLREIDIVVAKFIACMAVLTAMASLTLIYAAVLGVYGDPDWGPIYSGYVGLVMLGAALVSIGLMISALTANQIVAAVVSLGLFGLLWAIDTLASLLPHPFENWLFGLSLLAHFTPFAVGAMYVSDVGFFLTVILLGLFLTVRALARR